MRTWRFPRFSALLMLLRASASTFMRTMVPGGKERASYVHHISIRATLTEGCLSKTDFRSKRPKTDEKNMLC